MLVLDRSGSMASDGANPPEPLTDVKKTAADFLAQLQTGDQAGVVSFATTATLDEALSGDLTDVGQSVGSLVISSSTADQDTDIGDALMTASQALASANDTDKKIIILLTDGVPTDPVSTTTNNYPTLYAETAAANSREAGDTIFTVGLGNGVDADILKNIAGQSTNFFLAPDTSTLADIYQSIATSICERKPDVIEILSQPL
jgi:Mg-chelatase subunit ChlD